MILRCITEKPTRFRRKTRIKPELLMTNSVWLHPTRVSRGPTRFSQGRETLGSTRSLEAQLGGARQRASRGRRGTRDVLTVIQCGSRAGLAGWRRGAAGRQSAAAAPPSCAAVVHARAAQVRAPLCSTRKLQICGTNCVFNASGMWGRGACPALPPRR